VTATSPNAAGPNDANHGRSAAERTAVRVLITLSFCHLLNDMMQTLLLGIYPLLKTTLDLDFGQIGLITLTFQMTASILQPLVGIYTDRRPQPFALAIGMGCTLAGLLMLSVASTFPLVLLAAGLTGIGSSVFHPESSRIARTASGGRHGFAQSLFQVGGNFGSSLGPLLAAFIVLPRGQSSIAWFSGAALLAIVLLWKIGHWYKKNGKARHEAAQRNHKLATPVSSRKIGLALTILVALIFSKFFYVASFTSYFMFYLIDKFHVPVQVAQIHLFIFLGAVAAGTIIGGPLGDRFGRKVVIWCSIAGVLPFTLLLPYANLFWTGVLSVPIGLILASAFPAIVVYAQELMPGRVGMVSGLLFGFAFGMAGIGAAALGELADHTSIEFVYGICAYLPVIGFLTAFLPKVERARRS
jgi:FSR family fosmidomycin resistance protein-like MFS transporter